MAKAVQPLEPVPTTWDDIVKLAARAEKGDAKTLPALREILKNPAYVNALGGDLARVVQKGLVNKLGGENLLLQESVKRKLELLREELAGEKPTALERLLVERVVTCWLHLHHLEAVYASKDNMSLALGDYFQRCLSAAQKRYLAAIKTLATVRKLALPALQVNIAEKQVNVAGAVSTE